MATLRSRLSALAGGRVALVLLGAVVASIVWLIVVRLLALTPQQAAERRAAPELASPTVQLRHGVLRQVTWNPCNRTTDSTDVNAPATATGDRAVVTSVAHAGTPVKTGTVLAEVAGQPVIAVVTDGVFYRDLAAGDSGPDVRAFTAALAESGIIGAAADVLTESAVAAWQAATGTSGPSAVIPWRSLVAVPAGATIGSVAVATGDAAPQGKRLLTVQVSSAAFECSIVLGASGSTKLTPHSVIFEVDGAKVPVAQVVTRADGGRSRLATMTITPKHRVRSSQARVGVVASSTGHSVLAAPLSAITSTPSGDRAVVVVDENGSTTEVPVTLGSAAGGWIEVAGSGLTEQTRVEMLGRGSGTSSKPRP